ncbi:MAG: nuclear transport factor 2 family protein [Acidobacteria bacterium]|nr:nuclear transport factor 2 family protein [Acidobacteriota bacterium]
MTAQAARLARVHRLVAALNDHDVAAAVEHVADTVTRSRGDGSSLVGKDTLGRHLQDFLAAFAGAVLTSVHVMAFPPDAVLVEWVLEATILATGRAVRVVGADLLGFNSSGQIAWDEARVDAAALSLQPGVLSNPWPDPARILELAQRYTAAWCSQDPASVAAFYAPQGSLSVNGGSPAIGRSAITEVARGFMAAFPDLQVLMDGLLVQGGRSVYQWTLAGANTGPGGTGQRVRLSGFEVQQIGADGLIVESRGHFDSGAYQRQLQHGASTGA